MASSLFQVTGISSGIEWGSIIDKTIEAAKAPATQWQSQIDTLELKKTLYQQMSSEFYKLRNTLTKLKLTSTYQTKTPEFFVHSPTGASPSSIAMVTAKTDAEIAQWDLNVEQIARAQRHISARVSEAGSALGLEGTFRIMEDERWTTITIGKSDTLRDINIKLQNCKDQFGNAMPISSQLIDNRLVIDSANAGLNQVDTKTLEPLKMSSSNLMYLPRAGVNYSKKDADGNYVQSSYPQQLLSVSSNGTEYQEGVDFSYDADKGLITWLTTNKPTEGSDVDLLYTKDVTITKTSAGYDLLPYLNTGVPYDSAGMSVAVFNPDGGKYTEWTPGCTEWDYKIEYGVSAPGVLDANGGIIVWNTTGSELTGNTLPTDGSSYTIRLGADNDYSTSQNKFYIEADDMSSSSLLASLGFITIDEDTGDWSYTEGSVIEAQDAKFTLNGVPVTRQTNKIEDLIANVTLELKGAGNMTINITQDAEAAVEAIEAFVEQYNVVMEWINTYLNQKGEASNPKTSDDSALDELLNDTKGKTVFGPLHGDTLLWSIKNQMRNLLANPVSSLSGTLNTKKYLNPGNALEMQGSFYIHVGGMSARIDLSKEDSLEDLQTKINAAVSSVSNTEGTPPATQNSLGLEATISNGQLVIKTKKVSTETSTRTDTLTRSSDRDYDYLPYTPQTSSPTDGVVVVTSGSKSYEEGTHFTLAKEEDADGTIKNKIVWKDPNMAPKAGSTYNVNYAYNSSAISYEYIGDASSSLKTLDLHQDSSKVLLSQYGLATESTDYGKSGLLEFDSDKFFEAIKSDSTAVASAMSTFMRQIDTYIGNLVDSTDVIVGGTQVTKGRVANKLKSIDTEIGNLNDQITKLETSLEEKQNALYKQYTAMETAIQKLNAQLSSITQYFNNQSNN